MNPILKFGDNFTVDESICSKEIYAFNPITGTQLNNPVVLQSQFKILTISIYHRKVG